MSRAVAVGKAGVAAVLVAVNRPLAGVRLRRRLAGELAPYSIEIGSNRTTRPDWICTDIGWRARYWLDATERWPVPPRSVARVYGDNVIEHMHLDSAREAFRHAWEAMAPGARIRLVTPDAERFARMYLERGPLLDAHSERNRRHGYRVDHPVSVLRTVFAECGHHLGFIWDLDSLSTELAAAGFKDPARMPVNESSDDALCGLESRVEPADAELYLVLEAVRP